MQRKLGIFFNKIVFWIVFYNVLCYDEEKMREICMKEKKQVRINYQLLKKDFIIVNGVAGGAMLAMLVAMILQKLHILPSFPCIFHDVFHLYCPGCGGTRALFAFLHGQVLQSLYYNPAIVLGALLILYYEIGVLVTLIKKNGKRYFYPKGGLLYFYIAIVAVFTIVRNYLLIGFQYDMLKDFII